MVSRAAFSLLSLLFVMIPMGCSSSEQISHDKSAEKSALNKDKIVDSGSLGKQAWMKDYQDAKVSAFSEDYAVAEQQFAKVLKQVSDLKGKELLVADIKARMAKIYIKQGHVNAALPLVKECLSIAEREKVDSAENSELLVLMDDLAELIHGSTSGKETDYPERLKLALKLQRFSHTGIHNRSMLIEIKLANYYIVRDKLEEALPHINEALAITSDKSATKVFGKVSLLVRLSLLLRSRGYDKEADRVYAEVSKKLDEVAPKKARAFLYMNMGTAYGAQKDYKQALSYLNKCLAEQKRLGDISGQAATLMQMAKIAEDKGQIKEADHLYSQAIALQRKSPGSLSQDLVKMLERYRDFLLRHGDKRKAMILEKEARSFRGEFIEY